MTTIEALESIHERARDAGVRLLDIEDAIEHVEEGELGEALIVIQEALQCKYAKANSWIAQLLNEAADLLTDYPFDWRSQGPTGA